MTLNCEKCNRPFTCNANDTALAWKEVYVALINHYKVKHPKTTARVENEIAALQMLVEGYIKVVEFAVINPENTELQTQLEVMQAQILDELGIELDEVDDEEEDDDNVETVETANKVEEMPLVTTEATTESTNEVSR